jgi:PAS domain S-box-containing protein
MSQDNNDHPHDEGDAVNIALREAYRKFEEANSYALAIIESSLLAIITMKETGEIIAFNPAAETMFGRRYAEVRDQDLAELIIPERYRQAHRHGIARYLATAQPHHIGRRVELIAVRADGSEFPIEMTMSVARFDGVQYFSAFISDLTESRKVRDELARQREALRQSEKLSAMGAMLAGVAHELNNPLAILMGRATLLEAKVTDPLIVDDVKRINAAAERCGRIVRTFLSMARQKPANRQPAQLNQVVSGALELLGYNLRAAGIKVHAHLSADLPLLNIDADQIGQIVVNLLVNAQQALESQSSAKEIVVETMCSGDEVLLRVTDNGVGVEDALRERIFEAFFTTKTAAAGTGIGLSVSRAIAREHGGELALDAAQQSRTQTAGARFLLTLPLSPATTMVSPSAVLFEQEHCGTVLVVDDENDMAELLADILRSAGYQAYATNSAKQALDWLQMNTCDFVFCDMRMPEMDGAAFWRELQQHYPQLARRTAFITGDTLSLDVEPFLQLSGQSCLEKPFSPEAVLSLAADLENRR